jgi:outer membrane immunogenic protein
MERHWGNTMKKSILGLVAFGALIAAPAMAADLRMPVKAPPAPIAPVFSWTGLYIGVQGGWGWGTSSATATSTNFCPAGGACGAVPGSGPIVPPIALDSINTNGGFIGATAGFNYQFNQIVVGIEGDWSGADINGSAACTPSTITGFFGAPGPASGTCTSKLRDFATLDGRLGWAWDRALLYVKGGGAWARFNQSAITTVAGIPGPAASFGTDREGWTIGVGVEYAFTNNWSLKVEWQHMDFGTTNVAFPFVNTPAFAAGVFNVNANDTERVDIIRGGLNYRFNFGGGPVAARY